MAGEQAYLNLLMANLKSSIRDFALAGAAIVLAFAGGVQFLGKPLRLVELVTIIGLGMTAGVSWAQAIWRARQNRSGSR
jgi:hypothetical protein